MSSGPWTQNGYGLRFEWGPGGVTQVADRSGVLVIVDVLSFTTSVTVAAARAVAVYPAAWRDARAGQLARQVDAVLAVGRGDVTAEHPWSLSPAALLSAPAPPRLVLPSPNGSAIAAAAEGVVVAASLRNVTAVAHWLRDRAGTPDRPVTVIAAGERWPDGSLRPALEDVLGAGGVLAALAADDRCVPSPEAEAAIALFRATASLPDVIRRCASGVELASAGFGDDVEVAVQLDANEVVPVLTDGAFRAA